MQCRTNWNCSVAHHNCVSIHFTFTFDSVALDLCLVLKWLQQPWLNTDVLFEKAKSIEARIPMHRLSRLVSDFILVHPLTEINKNLCEIFSSFLCSLQFVFSCRHQRGTAFTRPKHVFWGHHTFDIILWMWCADGLDSPKTICLWLSLLPAWRQKKKKYHVSKCKCNEKQFCELALALEQPPYRIM